MEGRRLQPKLRRGGEGEGEGEGEGKGKGSGQYLDLDPHLSFGRSKRDAKKETERPSTGNTDGIQDVVVQDSKYHRQTQDSVPVEDLLQETIPKTEHETIKKRTDPKFHESKPTHVPNAGSYRQHDRSAVPNSRNVRRRISDHGSWSDSTKGRSSDRHRDRSVQADAQGRVNGGQVLTKEECGDRVWCHDRFFELEVNGPHERRKPPFRETKVVSRVVGSGSKSTVANDEDGCNKIADSITREGRGDASEQQNEFDGGSQKNSEIEQKDKDRDHVKRNNDFERGRWLERDQYNDEFHNRGRFSSISSGRERMGRHFNGSVRNELRSRAFTGEKWKHDLFDEANRSPTPKNEEEQIAKIELLLAG